MSVLGNNSGAGADTTAFANGRMWAAKWLAPEDGVISEFHIDYDSGQETLDLAVYGPGTLNQPGARIGHPGTVQTNTTGTVSKSITGLSIPFSAGAVWLAAACEANFGGHLLATDGGGASGAWTAISSAKLASAYPAPDPFPTIDFGPDDRKFRIWVVYATGPSAAPVNTVAPAVTGTAALGSTLTCDTGTWDIAYDSIAYQWYKNGVAISLATASTWVVVGAAIGDLITCKVITTNAIGPSIAATSNTKTVVDVTTKAAIEAAIGGTKWTVTVQPQKVAAGRVINPVIYTAERLSSVGAAVHRSASTGTQLVGLCQAYGV